MINCSVCFHLSLSGVTFQSRQWSSDSASSLECYLNLSFHTHQAIPTAWWGVPYPLSTSGGEYLTHLPSQVRSTLPTAHLPPPTCHLPPWVCGVGSERWVGGGWAGGRWVAGDGWAVAHRPPLEGLTRNYIEIKGTHHPPVTSNYPPLEETAIVNFSPMNYFVFFQFLKKKAQI